MEPLYAPTLLMVCHCVGSLLLGKKVWHDTAILAYSSRLGFSLPLDFGMLGSSVWDWWIAQPLSHPNLFTAQVSSHSFIHLVI